MSRYQPTVVAWFAGFFVLMSVVAASEGPPAPGPKDRCAVCGMFVAKYPHWITTIVSSEGNPHFFDGPKDLFRYLEKNGQGSTEVEIWVTDYYTTKAVNAREAYFVAGSDVHGPMGAELVPLVSAELAESFREDHGGEKALTFDEIDEAVLRSLDEQ